MSVPTIKYIGRKTNFRGKTLWEILGNLKNFGVGRIVTRSMFERYPEKSFMKIIKVEAQPNDECRKVKVTVEKTFRGNTYVKPVVVLSTSYKSDYRLIPKHEELDYCRATHKNEEKILPTHIDLPPLFKEFIIEETCTENPKIKIKFKPSRDKFARLAKEGENPNVKIGMNLEHFIRPDLFQNIQ